MNSKWLRSFAADGVIVFRDDAPLRRPLVAESIYHRVKKLIADLRFNDSGNSMIISSTAYIKDPFATVEGLASLVLAPDLKALLISLFGDEPILTSCAIQKKILPHSKGIKPHYDPDQGIGVIHYLNDCNNTSGATIFYKGSHLKRPSQHDLHSVNDAIYFLPSGLSGYEKIGENGYKAGDIVVFDRGIIHSVDAYNVSGRIVILSVFHPRSIAKDIEIDTTISIQAARNLSDSQKSLIGLGLPGLESSQAVIVDMAKKKNVYSRSFARSIFWILRAKVYTVLSMIGVYKVINK